MPLWLAVLTMTATWVNGGYLLGTVEGTFTSGNPLGAQGGLCFGVSLILGGLFFARRMRRFEFTTLRVDESPGLRLARVAPGHPMDVGSGTGLAGRRVAGLSGVLHGRVLGDVDPVLAAGGSAARSPP